MYMCRARLRDNSPARLPLLCTYRLHVCPHEGYVRIIPAQRRAEFQRDSVRTLPQFHTCSPKWRFLPNASKRSNWGVRPNRRNLSSSSKLGDFCPSPRNCLIGVEQAVVSSAAILISRHCPMSRRTNCRGTTLSVATAFPAPAPTCSSCWKLVLPNRWPTRTTRRLGCARLR